MICFVFVFVSTKNNNVANFAKNKSYLSSEDKGNISAASVIDKLPIDYFMFTLVLQYKSMVPSTSVTGIVLIKIKQMVLCKHVHLWESVTHKSHKHWFSIKNDDFSVYTLEFNKSKIQLKSSLLQTRKTLQTF